MAITFLHRGRFGEASYHPIDGYFRGELLGVDDGCVFSGRNLQELVSSFRDVVDARYRVQNGASNSAAGEDIRIDGALIAAYLAEISLSDDTALLQRARDETAHLLEQASVPQA